MAITLAWGLIALCSVPLLGARRERLDLKLLQIPLEGSPVAIVPADLNGDGLGDLVIALAFTSWDQISVNESVEMDAVEGLVEMMTVVPALADERKLVVLLGQEAGGFAPYGKSFELANEVLSLEAGPPGFPVLATTDEGLAVLELTGSPEEPGVNFRMVERMRPVLAGSGLLLPRMRLVNDLDGDGISDVLFPVRQGYEILLWRDGRLERQAERAELPPREELTSRRYHRMFPLPTVADTNGDGLPDLIYPHPESRWNRFWVSVNLGDGRFGAPYEPLGGPWDEDQQRELQEFSTDEDAAVSIDTVPEEDSERAAESRSQDTESVDENGSPVDLERALSYFGDVDGDGVAEYLEEELRFDPDAGMRKELKQAKNPEFMLTLKGADRKSLAPGPVTQQFESLGYAFQSDDDFPLPGGFEDLNGDGRQDLVSLTLDFSILQIVRVMASKSLSIGLDFHIRCQQEDGSFRLVKGMDLSGKFKIDFNDMRLGQLSQFAGDFDGDSRRDFVQIGRGKTVGIHRGREDCGYPSAPDLVVKLKDEPKNLALIRVDDFDLDGLADLIVIQPQTAAGDGSSTPVRLDFYSSRGGDSP